MLASVSSLGQPIDVPIVYRQSHHVDVGDANAICFFFGCHHHYRHRSFSVLRAISVLANTCFGHAAAVSAHRRRHHSIRLMGWWCAFSQSGRLAVLLSCQSQHQSHWRRLHHRLHESTASSNHRNSAITLEPTITILVVGFCRRRQRYYCNSCACGPSDATAALTVAVTETLQVSCFMKRENVKAAPVT